MLLPPAYVRTTGGYVFTGVCLFTFRGGGYPISGLSRGGPHLSSRETGYPIPDPGPWGYPIPGPGGYPIPGPRGVPHPRSGGGVLRVQPPGIASTCYSYTAGGMPLAFTQEDFLVYRHVFSEFTVLSLRSMIFK